VAAAGDRPGTHGLTVRLSLDRSWQRFGSTVLAGSPLRLFRTTPAGSRFVDEIEAGADVGGSTLVDRLLDAGAVHPRPDPVRAPAGARRFAVGDVTVVTPQFGGAAHRDGRITVDDGSRPPVVGATLRLERNRGPGAARNAARPMVSTPLVAFLDADVDVDVDVDDEAGPGGPRGTSWLAALLGHFDDPRVGLVAPRVRGESGSPLDLGTEPARVRAGTRVSYVPGAAIVVRVEAFDAIGGFDEGLRFGEDVDFVWRLDEAGWRCRYEPLAEVWHAPRSTWPARLRQHAGYGTSAAPLALRHPRALSPSRVNGWTAAAWGLLVAGHPVTATALAAGSAAALVGKLPDIPPRQSFLLAMRGHVMAGQQFASAVRRVWWPIVAAGAVVSRRVRWVAVAAVLADARATPTDMAYGWGVWKGMRRHRTWAPIIPRLSAWPGRRT
jgi:mycofactocin glycosyltransferase